MTIRYGYRYDYRLELYIKILIKCKRGKFDRL